MRRYLYICAVVVTQLLACTSVDPLRKEVKMESLPGYSQKILAIKDWRLRGRLAVRSEKESWLTALEWQHAPMMDDLVLSTALGGTVAQLVYLDDVITFTDINGRVQKVSEGELASLLGYSPPLSHLRYWVRGVPDPALIVSMADGLHANERFFEQAGWRVRLGRFNQYNDIALPSRVWLSKGGLMIKLVIDEWL